MKCFLFREEVIIIAILSNLYYVVCAVALAFRHQYIKIATNATVLGLSLDKVMEKLPYFGSVHVYVIITNLQELELRLLGKEHKPLIWELTPK